MWGVTSFGDELTGDFCDGFEAISIGDFGLFYRLAGKIVSRILGLLQQYRPTATDIAQSNFRFWGKSGSGWSIVGADQLTSWQTTMR
jgi:hypothetical protein